MAELHLLLCRLCTIETTAKRREDNDRGGAAVARKKSIVVSVTFPEDNDAKRGMRLPRVFRFVIVSGALIMYSTWRLVAASQPPNSRNRKTFRYFIKIVIIITACYDLLSVSPFASRSCSGSSATCINISMCLSSVQRLHSRPVYKLSPRVETTAEKTFFLSLRLSAGKCEARSTSRTGQKRKNPSAILCCCLSRFSV